MKDIIVEKKNIDKQNNKIVYSVAVPILLLGFIAIGTYAFWSLYPYKTFTANVQPFVVIEKELQAGDTLIFQSDVCRHRVGEVEVHRSLNNDVLISFTNYTFFQDKIECTQYDNASLELPDNLPAGEYHLEITSFMQVNPIRRVSTTFVTEKFNIIK